MHKVEHYLNNMVVIIEKKTDFRIDISLLTADVPLSNQSINN